VTTGGLAAWRVPPVETAQANAVVHGAPSLVYRWLWGRLPDRFVEREGELEAINQLWALLRVATR
jgi:hypothetical protein